MVTPRALDDLHASYARRHSALADAGASAVSVVGFDVPLELVDAAGLQPVRLCGDPATPLSGGSGLLDPHGDGEAKSIFDRLRGDRSVRSPVLIGHDRHALLRLFFALRAEDREAAYFCDLVHMPYRTSGTYNVVRLRQLAAVLGDLAGRSIHDDDLSAAIARRNAQKARIAALLDLRRGERPRLTGRDVLAIVSTAQAMSCTAHVALLDDLLEHGESLPAHQGPRVLLTGSEQDHPAVCEAIEALGFVVVAEDHSWGERFADAMVAETGDPYEALSDRLLSGPPGGAKFPVDARARYTATVARRGGAELALAWIRDRDNGPRWDVPDQRARLAELGLPLSLVDDQPYHQSIAAITATLEPLLLPHGLRRALP